MFNKIKLKFYSLFYSKLNKSDNSIKLFSFENKSFIAKVVDVYDGDTITVVFKFAGKRRKFKIRMNNYDTPELRTKDPIEKVYAQKAKDELEYKIKNKLIKLVCGKFDKYGRILGTVFTLDTNENINDFMIKSKFGICYQGKTKMDFQEAYKIGLYPPFN